MQEIIEEKASLNNEYQKLNKSINKIKEQNDLLVLYSTYKSITLKIKNLFIQ